LIDIVLRDAAEAMGEHGIQWEIITKFRLCVPDKNVSKMNDVWKF